MSKEKLALIIFDLSEIISQKKRELLNVINPGLLNLLYETDEAINKKNRFEYEFEKHSRSKMDWLNTNLNLSLWELGKRINVGIFPNKETTIRDISTQLGEKYRDIFSEIDLYAMAKLAEIFPDKNVALEISTLLRWEYFPVLLSLSEPEAIFFYARLTVTQGLSIADLQTQIDNKTYENTNGAKERAQSSINALQNPVTKTKVTTKENSTVVATTIYLEDNNIVNLDLINIFKNPSLYILTSRPR